MDNDKPHPITLTDLDKAMKDVHYFETFEVLYGNYWNMLAKIASIVYRHKLELEGATDG